MTFRVYSCYDTIDIDLLVNVEPFNVGYCARKFSEKFLGEEYLNWEKALYNILDMLEIFFYECIEDISEIIPDVIEEIRKYGYIVIQEDEYIKVISDNIYVNIYNFEETLLNNSKINCKLGTLNGSKIKSSDKESIDKIFGIVRHGINVIWGKALV